MPKHIFFEPKDISPDDAWGQLHIVDGGLILCKVCGLLEGALTTDCPGEKVSMDVSDCIYAGEIDYKDDKGWVTEYNPINISWLYGSYVRFNGLDEEFAKEKNIDYGYFTEIKKGWVIDGLNIEKINNKNKEIHHIKKDLKKLEAEINNRGYKNDIVINIIFIILKNINKELEKIKEYDR